MLLLAKLINLLCLFSERVYIVLYKYFLRSYDSFFSAPCYQTNRQKTMNKSTIILAAVAVVVIMNIVSFALMGHEKRWARLKSRRDFKSGRSRTADGSK